MTILHAQLEAAARDRNSDGSYSPPFLAQLERGWRGSGEGGSSQLPCFLRFFLKTGESDSNSRIVTGEKVPKVHMLPDRVEDTPADLPEFFKDLTSYYRVRQPQPRASNTCLPRSWDLMANFDALLHNDMISPRPLLMITGTKVATKCYSEYGVETAKDPKELFVIDGLTHADLYDHVDVAGPKLVEFFGKNLK